MDNKIQGGEPPAMDAGDWRTQFKPEYRQEFVDSLSDTLKKHMLSYDLEEDLFLDKVKRVSQRLEERFYNGATSESSYLGKISLVMSELKEDHGSPDQESPAKRQKVSESDGVNSICVKRIISSFLNELSVEFLMAKRRRLLVELAAVKAEMQRRVAIEELNHDRRELGLLKAYWDGIRWCRDMVILENPGIALSFEFLPPGFDDEDDDDDDDDDM